MEYEKGIDSPESWFTGPSAIQGSGWNSWRRLLLFSSVKKRVNRLESSSASYLVWLVRNNHRLPGPLLAFSPSPPGDHHQEPGQTTKDDGPCFLPSSLVITTDWQQPEGDLNVSRDLLVFDAPFFFFFFSSSSFFLLFVLIVLIPVGSHHPFSFFLSLFVSFGSRFL